jgi:Uma2 family endonuclease
MNPQNTRGLFSYPDIVIICGEPEHHDEFTDAVLNPIAIVEVLSPSTEAFDRGEKFTRLPQWNPSLRDFVLVSQDKPQVEPFHRLDSGTWSNQLIVGLEQAVTIPSIGCTVGLADIYDRITFPRAE